MTFMGAAFGQLRIGLRRRLQVERADLHLRLPFDEIDSAPSTKR
jgi:hypothetical protein